MNRAPDYLNHMLEAVQSATSYIAGMDKAQFSSDKRIQQAAVINLILTGEVPLS
jgi:uncharacterized protein with HEPN domain